MSECPPSYFDPRESTAWHKSLNARKIEPTRHDAPGSVEAGSVLNVHR